MGQSLTLPLPMLPCGVAQGQCVNSGAVQPTGSILIHSFRARGREGGKVKLGDRDFPLVQGPSPLYALLSPNPLSQNKDSSIPKGCCQTPFVPLQRLTCEECDVQSTLYLGPPCTLMNRRLALPL